MDGLSVSVELDAVGEHEREFYFGIVADRREIDRCALERGEFREIVDAAHDFDGPRGHGLADEGHALGERSRGHDFDRYFAHVADLRRYADIVMRKGHALDDFPFLIQGLNRDILRSRFGFSLEIEGRHDLRDERNFGRRSFDAHFFGRRGGAL